MPGAGGNRMFVIVASVLAGAFVVGGIVAGAGGGKGKAKPKSTGSARAVVVPTDDRARTIVVPPCSAPTDGAIRRSGARTAIPGATTVELPRGPGLRTVLVPHCSPANRAGVVGKGDLPSAAFVLAAGARPPTGSAGTPIRSAGATSIQSQVIVPAGSETATIVVPPCSEGSGKRRGDVVLRPEATNSGAVIAPSC
jgi:hypothetical protein